MENGREARKDNDLFFTCALIDYIARKTKNTRADVVNALGKKRLDKIYDLADIYHSDNIDRVSEDFIEEAQIKKGNFDNVGECQYAIPTHWDIGKVYKRLIKQVSKKEKKNYALELYDLTTLQKEASKRYGFSPKQTLNIMQSLYEHHKVLTYPRTDSRYLTNDMTDTLKDRIKACQNGSYKKAAATLLRKEIKASSRFINDKKVSDHHAIIPTEQYASLTSFSSDERKIYDMVVARFLAILSAPAISEQLSVKASINGELFRAKAENIKQLGWRELYEEETQTKDTIKAGNIPVKGKEYPVGTISMTEGTTNPPGRYTEGTLIDQMDKKGLGTVATRADIIDKLFNSYLLEKKGNEIHITSKGKQLLELVPEDLKKAELTADWEKKLTAISKGKQNDQKDQNRVYARPGQRQRRDDLQADGRGHERVPSEYVTRLLRRAGRAH